MLTAILILSALGAVIGLGCLILLLEGRRERGQPAGRVEDGERGHSPGESKLQEGIANLLSYDIGGNRERGE